MSPTASLALPTCSSQLNFDRALRTFALRAATTAAKLGSEGEAIHQLCIRLIRTPKQSSGFGAQMDQQAAWQAHRGLRTLVLLTNHLDALRPSDPESALVLQSLAVESMGLMAQLAESTI